MEKLTRDLEEEALAYFDTIDRMGGMVAAIERGYPQKEIAESAYRFQQAVEQRDRIVVGVNEFVEEQQEPVGILYIDESVGATAAGEAAAREKRPATTIGCDDPSTRLQAGAQGGDEHDAASPRRGSRVRHVGEMCDALRDVWGEYEETPVI